jgi:hypothetical protein
MKGISALYEYIDAKLANVIPGAVVLGGWPALPWGQRGMGPRPASLDAILEAGVTQETLDLIIDHCFSLDSVSPPQYMVGCCRLNTTLTPGLHK